MPTKETSRLTLQDRCLALVVSWFGLQGLPAPAHSRAPVEESSGPYIQKTPSLCDAEGKFLRVEGLAFPG